MLINLLLLAITLSLDSLGVGITYGIRDIKIATSSKIILFFLSFIIILISLTIGSIALHLFPFWLTSCLRRVVASVYGMLDNVSKFSFKFEFYRNYK